LDFIWHLDFDIGIFQMAFELGHLDIPHCLYYFYPKQSWGSIILSDVLCMEGYVGA
jgi:hypothetical protein